MKCLLVMILYSSCTSQGRSAYMKTAHHISGMWHATARRGGFGAYLTSSINNLSCKLLALVFDDGAEGVLNGRVVALNKVVLNELHSERRLA